MNKAPTSNSSLNLDSDFDKKSWNQEFGHRLRKAREKCGLNQVELSKKIGVNKNTIQNYESGGRPRGDYLVAIADVLNCSTDWLLRGIENKSSSQDVAEQHPEHETRLQVDLLKTIIRAIERELQQRDLELDPDKKAEAISLLYEMYADTEKEVTEQTVVRYLKLVA
jgi:transcriptional regulator with XRE-family HTH domain